MITLGPSYIPNIPLLPAGGSTERITIFLRVCRESCPAGRLSNRAVVKLVAERMKVTEDPTQAGIVIG